MAPKIWASIQWHGKAPPRHALIEPFPYASASMIEFVATRSTGKAGTEPRTVNLNHWNWNRQTRKAETELEIRNRLEPEPGKIYKIIYIYMYI